MLSYTRTKTVLLDIQHVNMKFGDRLILRDVDATVFDVTVPGHIQGQVICFLGPSGIGKTQLSRIIAGLQLPTTGAVTLLGGVPTHKGAVGMVPQNYPLFDYATVETNLAIAGAQAGLTAGQAKDKAAGFIKAFGLQDYVALYPSALSGGTKQRVAIARQMMCADHYLVMDEPFSGLDPISKRNVSEMILTLANLHELNTVIVVTHDISEGLSVADTVWLMGYEPNPKGGFYPGARLVETYDLAAMDLCWHPDIGSDPHFLEFVGQIKKRFQTLR